MDKNYYRMVYNDKNVFSFWYETEIEARDKGIIDIYYNVAGMRWYERDYCVLETKTIKNDDIIENMYKNKNKYFNNIENWAYIYKK